MPDGERESAALTVRALGAIDAVDAAQWDACAGPANPFVGHAFLKALEDSGSVAAETGWMPRHLVVEDGAGGLLGAAPAYIKSNSFGEYVFDHGWADAYERAGGKYYPKLVIAVPFTPAPGPRLLVRPGADATSIERGLVGASVELAKRLELSSVHINFTTEDQWRRMGEAGLLTRKGLQFHWHNRGYAAFDDFLADLTSRKRKAIRKERREAMASGVTIERLTGAAIEERHWDAFFEFYMDTGSRKWGRPYLTRRFFGLMGSAMGERVMLVMVSRNGRFVAGALNLIGTDSLYGRYWGCVEDHRFLHFEVCYYQAIDFAIERRLARVEAGAQGPHKLQRGYVPVPTYSAHWIGDPGFRDAVANFLDQERREIDHEIIAAAQYAPFRKDGEAGV